MYRHKYPHGGHGARRGAAPPEKPDQVAMRLEKLNIGGPPSRQNLPYEERVESENVDQTQLQKDLDIMFEEQARDKHLHVPKIDMPPQLEGVTLFDHQLDGIRWLAHQEESGDMEHPFIKRVSGGGRPWWRCKITSKRQSRPPKGIKGGILADDMGLGKTLQTIGLILSNPPENHVYPPGGVTRQPLGEVSTNEPVCTLIVCPVSVMSNWIGQIESHVAEGVLRTTLYAGTERASIIPKIKNNQLDVVIVSYDTLRSDYENSGIASLLGEAPKKAGKNKKKKTVTLFDANFHRIVLDEGHTIRNADTGFYKSVSAVKADRKILLTGTPFVNRPDDIHSLLCFLGLEPLNDPGFFAEHITSPIQRGDPIGLATLRTTMGYVALRRTKNKTDIDLVGKESYIRKVSFPEGDHKDIHDVIYNTTQAAFTAVLQGEESPDYGTMFELVLRIRQACCSGELIPLGRYQAISKVSRELETWNRELTPSEGAALLDQLKSYYIPEDELEDDGGGVQEEVDDKENNTPMPNVRTERNKTRHEVKRSIIVDVESDDEACKSTGGDDSEYWEDSDDDADDEELSDVESEYSHDSAEDLTDDDDISDVIRTPKKKRSMRNVRTCHTSQIAPKIAALLHTIKELKEDEKGVIFSQFTTFLDKIQNELEASGHSCTRIVGSMNASARLAAMRQFSKQDTKKSPRFILCSLRAAGTGINLTRGNVAFMMDPWWNKAVENQAMDRVHRLGQNRKVRMYSFVMKDSIEERLVTLQRAKAALGKGSLEKLSPREERRAKLTAMKDLFEIAHDEEDEYDLDDDFISDDDEPEEEIIDDSFIVDSQEIEAIVNSDDEDNEVLLIDSDEDSDDDVHIDVDEDSEGVVDDDCEEDSDDDFSV